MTCTLRFSLALLACRVVTYEQRHAAAARIEKEPVLPGACICGGGMSCLVCKRVSVLVCFCYLVPEATAVSQEATAVSSKATSVPRDCLSRMSHSTRDTFCIANCELRFSSSSPWLKQSFCRHQMKGGHSSTLQLNLYVVIYFPHHTN